MLSQLSPLLTPIPRIHWPTEPVPFYDDRIPSPLWLFQQQDAHKLEQTIQETLEQDQDKDKRIIICRFCQHPITEHAAKQPINGKHRHIFTNPHGFIFEIGCFAYAPGCYQEGIPTLEYTWFNGYSWNFSACKNCKTHLGWFYQSGEQSFHGLILNRLTETSSKDNPS